MDATKHVFVIMGPAGCGKSTLAQYLAQGLNLPLIEGDDYHTEASKTKMRDGTALTDQDRWDWLITLREKAVETLEPNDDGLGPRAVFLACSALKMKYRDVLRVAAFEDRGLKVTFVYPRVGEDVLMKRVAERKEHYMKAEMVKGQLEALEEPSREYDVITVNGDKKTEVIAEELVGLLKANWEALRGWSWKGSR